LENPGEAALKAYEAIFGDQKTAKIDEFSHRVRRTSHQGARWCCSLILLEVLDA
jgi:hypothetical protein